MRYRRTLLINPPITQAQVYGFYASGGPKLPPLGFCYIASVFEKLGGEVRLMDCVADGSSFDDIERCIRDFSPDVVGVTSTTVSFFYAKQVIALAKRIDPGTLTMLGGAHVSAVPRETMEECPALDIGVYGEGEETTLEVMNALESGGSLKRIQGLCYRENGRVVMNPPRPNAKELDVFPPPARHLLKDLRSYSHSPFRGFSNTASIMSSRGCTFACSYCDQSVFQRRWRAHSAAYVVSEMKELIARYGIDFFSFEDDHFLINRDRVIELCKLIIREKLNVGWACSARANSFTPEVLQWMKKAGCRLVYVGVETGSQRMLDIVDKGIKLDHTRQGIKLCKAHGINVYGAFMIGMPTEKKEDIDASLDFALELPLDAVSCFIYVPYPATPMRPLALESGYVSPDWRDYSAHPTRLPFVENGFTQEYLLAKQREFYRRFYLRTGYIAGHLGNYLNVKTLKRVVRMLNDFYAKNSSPSRKAKVSAGAVIDSAAPGQRSRAHT